MAVDWSDKVALVTGSPRGIGAAIAALFAQRGAKVAIHGRDTTAISKVHSEIASAGGSFTPPAPLEDIPEEGWRASVDGI